MYTVKILTFFIWIVIGLLKLVSIEPIRKPDYGILWVFAILAMWLNCLN